MTEAELRAKVENCINKFSPTYLEFLQYSTEFHLPDTRKFKTTLNRRLDGVFVTSKGCCLVEYKRGIITQADIIECGFHRGYFELGYEHIPGLYRIVFVGEHVLDAAKFCKRIEVPEGVEIKTVTYDVFSQHHITTYLQWAKDTSQSKIHTLKTLMSAVAELPNDWMPEAKLEEYLKSFFA